MDDVTIRPAETAGLDAVAGLRWRWVLESGHQPVTTREEFVRHFVDWAAEHAGSHQCMVVVRDGAVIGMAWLAVVQRVPSPRARELGLERVTVHSSPRAVPAYARRGFAASPRLLHAHVSRADTYP